MSNAPSVRISLEGRVAFVTGSTRGIGWAIAETLASAGASIALNGRTSEAALIERAEFLEARHGSRVLPLFGDVTDAVKSKAFYTQILKTFGRLDVFVNNAGIRRDALIGMIDDALVDSVVQTNVIAVVRHLQSAARLMGRNPSGGTIINISSIVGVAGNAGQMVYAGTKAAVIGITRSAAKELADKRIRVNAIAPGVIETDLIGELGPEELARLGSRVRLGRLGTAQDVANVALFLASDLSSYVTGEVIGVDGAVAL